MDKDDDSEIDFEEFVAWWLSGSKAKTKGSVAYKMQKAREATYALEMDNNTPMGRLLAAKKAAAEKLAGGAGAASAKFSAAGGAEGLAASAGAAAGALGGAGLGSPKRCSHSGVPLYISLVIIHTKYTGVRENDSNV